MHLPCRAGSHKLHLARTLYSCCSYCLAIPILSQYENNGGVAATGWPQSFNELLLKIHQTPPNSK